MECEETIIKVSPHNPSSDAHKYSRGKLILCGGSEAYPGAVCLSAWASEYAGAGYTEVFTCENNLSQVRLFRPSLVVKSFDVFMPSLKTGGHYPFACVVGPGVDQGDRQARDVLIKAVRFSEAPLLIDGGALGFLAEDYLRELLRIRAKRGLQTVLTPHGGEAARLAAGFSLTNKSQESFACELAQVYACLVVLKGEDTVISDGASVCRVTHGTAALAKAGTGDVLAGIIGSFLAQGISPFLAAVMGVSLHADAGNRASEKYGMVSVCAEEVVEALPCAIKQAQQNPRLLYVETIQ